MIRIKWPVALVTVFALLLGWWVLYTQQIVRRVEENSVLLSRIFAEVQEGLLTQDPTRETQALVVAPYHNGQRGHPLLFDRRAWPRLLALPAGANPRAALDALPSPERVDVDDDSVLQDLDTPEAYAQAIGKR